MNRFWKICRYIAYGRYLFPGLKIYRLVKNIFGMPVIYDVFVSKKEDSVCVIAPYYSHNSFINSYCNFVSGGHIIISEYATIVDEPEKSCLIVLYKVPDDLKNCMEFNIFIKEKWRVLYRGNLPNIINSERLYKLSISTLIKYEARYLVEWIEHNLRIGVQHFYIYDNNSGDDVIKKTVSLYIEKGIVTYISWPYEYHLYDYRLKPFWPTDAHYYTQISQIHHVLYKYAHETEWVLACDVDEYFYSPGRINIRTIIDRYTKVVAIQVSGYLFGGTAEDRVKAEREGVVRSFLRSESVPTSSKKLIVNTTRIKTQSIHEVLDGGLVAEVSPDEIVFNHYQALGWKNRLEHSLAVETRNAVLFDMRSD